MLSHLIFRWSFRTLALSAGRNQGRDRSTVEAASVARLGLREWDIRLFSNRNSGGTEWPGWSGGECLWSPRNSSAPRWMDSGQIISISCHTPRIGELVIPVRRTKSWSLVSTKVPVMAALISLSRSDSSRRHVTSNGARNSSGASTQWLRGCAVRSVGRDRLLRRRGPLHPPARRTHSSTRIASAGHTAAA